MIRIIKWLLVVVLVLALIGGAIQFKSSNKDWVLIMNKQAVLNSVQNGSVKVYNFFRRCCD